MSEIDRLEFIREVLRSAPAGQFNAMLEDIQKLAGAPLDQDLLQDIQRHYECQTCSGVATTSSHEELSHSLAAPLRQAVETDKGNDENATTARHAITMGEDANTILWRTYAERVDEAKCKTGYWTAEWKIQSQPASSSAEVSGQVTLCAFSFEDGNIQLRSTKTFDKISIESESELELSASILKQIAAWQEDVLKSLNDSYGRARQNLKSLRGILPITHTRLNWNVVAQRTVRTLQETVNIK